MPTSPSPVAHRLPRLLAAAGHDSEPWSAGNVGPGLPAASVGARGGKGLLSRLPRLCVQPSPSSGPRLWAQAQARAGHCAGTASLGTGAGAGSWRQQGSAGATSSGVENLPPCQPYGAQDTQPGTGQCPFPHLLTQPAPIRPRAQGWDHVAGRCWAARRVLAAAAASRRPLARGHRAQPVPVLWAGAGVPAGTGAGDQAALGPAPARAVQPPGSGLTASAGAQPLASRVLGAAAFPGPRRAARGQGSLGARTGQLPRPPARAQLQLQLRPRALPRWCPASPRGRQTRAQRLEPGVSPLAPAAASALPPPPPPPRPRPPAAPAPGSPAPRPAPDAAPGSGMREGPAGRERGRGRGMLRLRRRLQPPPALPSPAPDNSAPGSSSSAPDPGPGPGHGAAGPGAGAGAGPGRRRAPAPRPRDPRSAGGPERSAEHRRARPRHGASRLRQPPAAGHRYEPGRAGPRC